MQYQLRIISPNLILTKATCTSYFAMFLVQLTTELSSALVADGVKIITNGLAFTGGLNDPNIIIQHLNVSQYPSPACQCSFV